MHHSGKYQVVCVLCEHVEVGKQLERAFVSDPGVVLCEALAALFTNEGLVSSVRAFVHGQVVPICEALAALLSHKGLLASVRAFVSGQAAVP